MYSQSQAYLYNKQVEQEWIEDMFLYVNANQSLEGLKRDYGLEMAELPRVRKELKAARFKATIAEAKYKHYMKILPAQIALTERFNYTEAEKRERIGVLKYKAECLEEKYKQAKTDAGIIETSEEDCLDRIERLKQLIRSKQ